MLPKYGHQKKLTPLAGALMIFADCYGGAARGLQPAFSLPAGFPLRARATEVIVFATLPEFLCYPSAPVWAAIFLWPQKTVRDRAG